MKPDLDSIYAELDIRPGCTLADFKRAYRRRIAELHPDREGSRAPEDQALLRDLIQVYEAVTRFHRRYGRMPGGTAAQPGDISGSRFLVVRNPGHDDHDTGDDSRRKRATVTLVGLFIALVLLLASWSWLAGGPQSGSRRGSAPPPKSEPAPAVITGSPAVAAAGARAHGGDPAARAPLSERHA